MIPYYHPNHPKTLSKIDWIGEGGGGDATTGGLTVTVSGIGEALVLSVYVPRDEGTVRVTEATPFFRVKMTD